MAKFCFAPPMRIQEHSILPFSSHISEQYQLTTSSTGLENVCQQFHPQVKELSTQIPVEASDSAQE